MFIVFWPFPRTMAFRLACGKAINNTRHTYFPIRLRRSGVYVFCRLDVVACHDFLNTLDSDLVACLRILPRSVRPLIQRTRLWANQTYMVGNAISPEIYNHTTTHHHEAWLIQNFDNPDKTLGIEIYSVSDYLRMRNHWNGFGLILHEFCHLIHQVILGLGCPTVIDLYHCAEQSGKYRSVLRRDWAGKAQQCDLAYCMVDHKEFFAEMSVTFLARCYRDLDAKDSQSMVDCCPPLTEPNVLTRLGIQKQPLTLFERLREWIRGPSHCNKFYPFTNGQLQHYDPDVYREMETLWSQIEAWRDPESMQTCCFWVKTPRNHLRQPLIETHAQPDTVFL